MKPSMPVIDTVKLANALTAEEYTLYARIVKPSGEIRASKPPIRFELGDVTHTIGDYTYTRRERINNLDDAKVAYVWRMVVFQVGTKPAHHCMPVTADWDLPLEDHAQRRELSKELDAIADRIVNLIPRNEWHGIIRWGNAMGQIGSPIVRENGTIVYRGS